MTQPADQLDDSAAAPFATRLHRLLDRMDARIVLVGRAIWRAVVEGFAVCGRVECALPINSPYDPDGEQAYVREAALMISHIYEVSDNDDLRGDFDDLRSLTDYVRAMDR
jgi:hypothetical protein